MDKAEVIWNNSRWVFSFLITLLLPFACIWWFFFSWIIFKNSISILAKVFVSVQDVVSSVTYNKLHCNNSYLKQSKSLIKGLCL